jgi:putative ABC transport system ATP-binding protein
MQIISLLQRINQLSGVTVVMVTHSMELASKCSRVIQVKDGLIA